MYADREAGATKVSIRDRLKLNHRGSTRQISGKRQRQDDNKWEHDLHDNDNPQVSNRRVGVRDLRLKLQMKSIQKSTQSGKGSLSGGVRDLREKLSGTMYLQPADTAPPKRRAVTEGSKTASKTVVVEAPVPETKKVATTVSKKKTQKKIESVDSFLHSLGLEKYSIAFQAEEVDMTALLHMNDEDLKAMGVPMGPRKKILQALDSIV